MEQLYATDGINRRLCFWRLPDALSRLNHGRQFVGSLTVLPFRSALPWCQQAY